MVMPKRQGRGPIPALAIGQGNPSPKQLGPTARLIGTIPFNRGALPHAGILARLWRSALPPACPSLAVGEEGSTCQSRIGVLARAAPGMTTFVSNTYFIPTAVDLSRKPNPPERARARVHNCHSGSQKKTPAT